MDDILFTLVDNAVAVMVSLVAIKYMGDSLQDSREHSQKREQQLLEIIDRLCQGRGDCPD